MNKFKATLEETNTITNLYIELVQTEMYGEPIVRFYKNKNSQVVYAIGYDENSEWDDLEISVHNSNGRYYTSEYWFQDWDDSENHITTIEWCDEIQTGEADWCELVMG